jgi:phospholipase C
MPAPDRSRALEHIVVTLFENRSRDDVLGHLHGPGGRGYEPYDARLPCRRRSGASR